MAHPEAVNLEKKVTSNETDDSDAENRKEEAHRITDKSDDLEGNYGSAESDVFDHKTRNAVLQSGEFSPPSGTIFEAIFQELRRKGKQEK